MIVAAVKHTYYHLLTAQILALVSTGVATIALALLAYDLVGVDAGIVFGTALGIKMLTYVTVTPIASALVERLPRRSALVFLDLVRAGVAFALPFVTRVWEIYLLIFIFQVASAVFTPVFQATIPDLLQDRRDYTRALSLSRLAVELENVMSPMAAALLLLAVNVRGLFICTVLGFIVSALIILRLALPGARQAGRGKTWDRMMRGFRKFLATPRLRGLMALNIAAAAATSMVVVNTVVIVQGNLGMSEQAVATAMAVFGIGSVCGALLFMYLIERLHDRALMTAGGLVVVIGLLAGIGIDGLVGLLPLWFALGIGCALAQTPAGVLICRSSRETDRQSLYAAQFALSHMSLLATYPLAGFIAAELGLAAAFLALGAVAAAALVAAVSTWPFRDGAALAASR